jgi:hypothetical protein
MDYVKGILSGLAAVFIAEFVLAWPFLKGSKDTGWPAIAGLFVGSLFSTKFWIVGVLLFGLFFAASRSRTIFGVLFFWIPTLLVSALGFTVLAMFTYFALRFGMQ